MTKRGRILLGFLLGTVLLMVFVTSEEMTRRHYTNRRLAEQEGSGVEQ